MLFIGSALFYNIRKQLFRTSYLSIGVAEDNLEALRYFHIVC